MKPAIIVHGGCFMIPDELKVPYMNGTTSSAQKGYDVLLKGGSAVDAVCAAVSSLEDLPQFNAGKGSCITRKGVVEMDAMVMNGKDLQTGAVCAVKRFNNPVILARKVMDNSNHCLLCGEGAEAFGESQGLTMLEDPSCLITSEVKLKSVFLEEVGYEAHVLAQHNSLYDAKTLKDVDNMTIEIARKKARLNDTATPGEDCHDTVGAVAIDSDGNIACATSTGGIPGKMSGRVGDSCLVGCGGYANEFGGASSTGHGEAMMRATTCRQAVYYMENGGDSSEASKKAIDYTLEKTGGLCGIICIDANGKVGHSFQGHRMAWAAYDWTGLHFGINRDDVRTDLKEIR